jgi:hypothetical protein
MDELNASSPSGSWKIESFLTLFLTSAKWVFLSFFFFFTAKEPQTKSAT